MVIEKKITITCNIIDPTLVHLTNSLSFKHQTTRIMDTVLQFYFLVGLVWATFWTVEMTTTGIQRLAMASRKQASKNLFK